MYFVQDRQVNLSDLISCYGNALANFVRLGPRSKINKIVKKQL